MADEKAAGRLCDISAEQAVLGALMVRNEAIAEVAAILKPEDFYRASHALIYRTMLEMTSSNKMVDMVTLHDQLVRDGNAKKIEQCAGYIALLNRDGIGAFAMHYAPIVKDYSIRRQLWRMSDELKSASMDLSTTVKEAQSNIADKVAHIVTGVTDDVSDIGDVIFEVTADILEGEEPGTKSGFTGLDYYTQGFKPGYLCILGACPSMGKTALALNIGYNVASKGGNVFFLSLEMSKKELAKRVIMCGGGFTTGFMAAAHREAQQGDTSKLDAISVACEAAKSMKFGIYESQQATVAEAAVRIQQWKVKNDNKLDLVIIDYLQLMNDPTVKGENRVLEVSRITRQLKLLARRLHVPILVLSQLNRSVAGRQDKRPMLSDLRESGSIEQDADVVMLLYRDEYYATREGRQDFKPWTEVNLAKNRNGEIGVVQLRFKSKYQRFDDWTDEDGEDVFGK